MRFLKIIFKTFFSMLMGCLPFVVTSAEMQKIAEEKYLSVSRYELTLEMAVKIAQQRDLWLAGNQHTQKAITAKSISAGTLPDPKASISMINLPTDTFNINQEAMTNVFKVSISQMFPRGDSLEIRKKQLELDASQYPFQRQDRKAKLAVIVSQLWLGAYKAQESIALIEKDKALFEQLVDVAEVSYSSAFGITRQQDIIRAQLELTRLEDRLNQLHQQQEMFQQRLSEWLSDYFLDRQLETVGNDQPLSVLGLPLDKQMPDLKLINSQFYDADMVLSPQTLLRYFSQHPAVKALEQNIKSSRAGIDLAKQKYKPEWGINASYGFRANDPEGNDQADFLSLGITFDVPLFTAKRQDKQVESAIYQTEAVKTKKWLLLRKLMAAFETAKISLLRLNERQDLYRSQLLPQMHELAEASLTAYTNDDGNFSEVVRARIADLNAEIDALDIDVERQKSIVQLNYFFTAATDQTMANIKNYFGEEK